MHAVPYAIEEHRSLTEEEVGLLQFLLQREAPERLSEIKSLRVIARCGCGRCPTILFGKNEKNTPSLGKFNEMANYIGKTSNGVVVGVALLEREGELSELEAWSPVGDDIYQSPSIASLESAN